MEVSYTDKRAVNGDVVTTTITGREIGHNFASLEITRCVSGITQQAGMAGRLWANSVCRQLVEESRMMLAPITNIFSPMIHYGTYGNDRLARWINTKSYLRVPADSDMQVVKMNFDIPNTASLNQMKKALFEQKSEPIVIDCSYGVVLFDDFRIQSHDGVLNLLVSNSNIYFGGNKSDPVYTRLVIPDDVLCRRVIGVIEELSQGHLSDNV